MSLISLRTAHEAVQEPEPAACTCATFGEHYSKCYLPSIWSPDVERALAELAVVQQQPEVVPWPG